MHATPVTAVGLGEILWDMLPSGRKLGGAPANFAYHFTALGGCGFPVSRVGNDTLGQEALILLRDNGVNTFLITVDPDHPTGRVDVSLNGDGVATYTFPDNVAWDNIPVTDDAVSAMRGAGAVCFGTLAQRSPVSAGSIRELLARSHPDCLRIFDINLRQKFYSHDLITESLRAASILKINDEELATISRMLTLTGTEAEQLAALRRWFGLRLCVLTRGEEGCLLLDSRSSVIHPGADVEIADTVGAGDSFTAAMALAYMRDRSLEEVAQYATEVAAHVCTCPGAMPEIPPRLTVDEYFG